MRNKMVINRLALNLAKEYADEFPDNLINHGGIEIHGHYFVPECSTCSSRKFKELKIPCRIKDTTYSYSCSQCKRPANVTATPIR